jgi:L-serine/L-threonine ammonia-lyase
MESLHIETPLLESQTLTDITGISVFLKLESLQPSGSFKNRGIGNLCNFYKKEEKKLLISSSGGNAGLAVAFSGKKLAIPVKVIVANTTPKFMQDKIKNIGAEVIVHGNA